MWWRQNQGESRETERSRKDNGAGAGRQTTAEAADRQLLRQHKTRRTLAQMTVETPQSRKVCVGVV